MGGAGAAPSPPSSPRGVLSAADAQGVVVSGLSGASPYGGDVAKFNGTYRPDPGAEQERGYAQEHGKGTIEKAGNTWYLCKNYSGYTYYRCDSGSRTPPLTGWKVFNCGTAPPPSLSPATPAQARPPAPAAPAHAALNTGQ